MSPLSAADRLISRPDFDDGRWHSLGELLDFERRLLAARQLDKVFSDGVRIDQSRPEKLRRDELVPFLCLAEHEGLPDHTLFRKPFVDDGVDIEYMNGNDDIVRLQVTTAYPVWTDATTAQLSGGYQYRLFLEKLTAQGELMGSGPFERRGNEIFSPESANSSDDIERACRLGLIDAFRSKATSGQADIRLVVYAVRYFEEIWAIDLFRSIVDAAAKVIFPSRFGEVIVVARGPEFAYTPVAHHT